MPAKIKKDEKAKSKMEEERAVAKAEKEEQYLQKVRLSRWCQNELFVDLKPHVSEPGYCMLPMNGLFNFQPAAVDLVGGPAEAVALAHRAAVFDVKTKADIDFHPRQAAAWAKKGCLAKKVKDGNIIDVTATYKMDKQLDPTIVVRQICGPTEKYGSMYLRQMFHKAIQSHTVQLWTGKKATVVHLCILCTFVAFLHTCLFGLGVMLLIEACCRSCLAQSPAPPASCILRHVRCCPSCVQHLSESNCPCNGERSAPCHIPNVRTRFFGRQLCLRRFDGGAAF